MFKNFFFVFFRRAKRNYHCGIVEFFYKNDILFNFHFSALQNIPLSNLSSWYHSYGRIHVDPCSNIWHNIQFDVTSSLSSSQRAFATNTSNRPTTNTTDERVKKNSSQSPTRALKHVLLQRRIQNEMREKKADIFFSLYFHVLFCFVSIFDQKNKIPPKEWNHRMFGVPEFNISRVSKERIRNYEHDINFNY